METIRPEWWGTWQTSPCGESAILACDRVFKDDMQQPSQMMTGLSIADIARGMLRRFVLILVCLLLGGLAGFGIITVNKPQYASEAQILVTNLSTPFDRPNAVQEPKPDPIDDRFVASQVAVLKSEDLATRVVRQLQLEGQGEFDPIRNGVGKIKKILLGLGFGTDLRLMQKEQRAVLHLEDNASIYQVPMSNVIVIRYTALDGKTAAAVANSLAETYVLSTRENESGTNARARDWLGGQIDVLRTKVAESEAAAERFRAEAGLLKGQTATLGAQEISELNSQITLAEAASSEARAKADAIKEMLANQGSVDASAEVLNNTVVQRLREQQVSAMRKVSELSATYLPSHPKMIAASRELTGIEKQLRREALKVVESLQGQAKVAKARADAMKQSLEELKTREGGALQSDVKLKELEREAAANRQLLETMLARFADANARQDLNLQPGYARIIQTAGVPAVPFFPKVGPTLLLTTLGGLALGLGLAFLFEVIRQSGRVAEIAARLPDVTSGPVPERVHVARGSSNVNIPAIVVEPPQAAPSSPSVAASLPLNGQESMPQLLASLPAVPQLIKAFVLLEDVGQNPELAEPFTRIAAAVTDAAAKGTKTFAFTSIGGAYDAAFASVALARLLASHKLKIVVVDVTASRPHVQDLMAIADGPGLIDLIAGKADVSKVIVRDAKSNLQAIRFGNGAHSAQMLNERMPSILSSLAKIYDIVILNAGEASAQTPDAVQGVGSVLFLATAARQKDAAVAGRILAGRGVRRISYLRIDPRDQDGSGLRAAG